MSILVAIIGLGLLIVLHEGGHFVVARLCGMRVERFSIGFGPTLLGFKRGGTTFQIAPIPLGGFVQITGLNPSEEFDHNDPHVYPNRPRWMRLATILAGPAANYLTAFVLMLVVLLGFGMPSKTQRSSEPVGAAGGAAGLLAGDVWWRRTGSRSTPSGRSSEVVRQAGARSRSRCCAGKPGPSWSRPTPRPASTRSASRSAPSTNGRRSRSGSPSEAVIYPYYTSVGILGGLTTWCRARCTPTCRADRHHQANRQGGRSRGRSTSSACDPAVGLPRPLQPSAAPGARRRARCSWASVGHAQAESARVSRRRSHRRFRPPAQRARHRQRQDIIGEG